MPLYEYRCDSCGTFSAIRKMSESSMPAMCDLCGSLSERVISAPHTAILGRAQHIAHERNEKSAHEPSSIRRSSCGCTGGHTCNTNTGKTQTKSDRSGASDKQLPGLQMQTKRTARPWMLGH